MNNDIRPRPKHIEKKRDNAQAKDRPGCFADLDRVFPMGSDGLRHTPDACLSCPCKTDCLRSAMHKKEGLKVHAERVDRAYRSGLIGFFERWAKRKALYRKMNP